MRHSFTLLDAPSILGLRPTGVEQLPAALRRAGLRAALGAHEGGHIPAPAYSSARDPATRLLNGPAIAGYAQQLARAVAQARDRQQLPIVLGGDCSILLGCMLALHRQGRFGLAFLDGHADFYSPEESPTGEVADMELGFVSGRGPRLLADLDGCGPLALDQDIVAIGFRDHAEFLAARARDVRSTAICALDLPAIRKAGAAAAATQAVAILTRPELDGFWIHLDADVICDEEMPAVDYRLPDGLRMEEVSAILRALLATGQAAGISVTIFNPTLDSDGSLARAFVDCIARGVLA
jgi:arginase